MRKVMDTVQISNGPIATTVAMSNDHSTQLAVAVGPTATIRRTLQISSMDELLSTFDTVEEAAASF